jgi:uncharacterized protein
MAQINVLADDVSLDAPAMIEGLPGVGLVGKIAADHLVETFDMVHYANVLCEGIPKVAVYRESDPGLQTPVRLYADPERDLLVLQSDVPISPQAATEFAGCFVDFFETETALPVYLSGIPREKSADVPSLYGIGVGTGLDRLGAADVAEPTETGLVSGPTGALLHFAVERSMPAVGLIVESDPQFPDPEASRVLIKHGIEPLLDLEVDVSELVDRAEEIREAKQRLARRMQEVDEESSQARPLGMYQ